MLYVDTSVLVAALTNEPATATMQAWLADQDPAALAISDWTVTEFSSALSLKLRSGRLTIDHRAMILSTFNRLVSETFVTIGITGGQFRMAARFVERHQLGLRAGDALHLAVASEHGSTVCTLDRLLAAAGPEIGVPTSLLG